MKPPERYPPDDPREWLNRARSNLVRARNRIRGAYLEDLCFDAQQAAEKAIKAVLIACDIAFPYVHDLDQLLTVLASTGQQVPDEIHRAGKLTPLQPVEKVHPGCVRPLWPNYCVALPPRIPRFDAVARLVFGHNDSASPAERLYQRTAKRQQHAIRV